MKEVTKKGELNNRTYFGLTQKFGRPKKYRPRSLWKKCVEYFDYMDSNKWHKNELIRGGELAGMVVAVETSRPYTKTGLCIFLNISRNTWNQYEADPDFQDITTRVNDIIFTQKFEGAAVGAFDPRIIARDLSLRDSDGDQLPADNIQPITEVIIVQPADQEVFEQKLRALRSGEMKSDELKSA